MTQHEHSSHEQENLYPTSFLLLLGFCQYYFHHHLVPQVEGYEDQADCRFCCVHNGCWHHWPIMMWVQVFQDARSSMLWPSSILHPNRCYFQCEAEFWRASVIITSNIQKHRLDIHMSLWINWTHFFILVTCAWNDYIRNWPKHWKVDRPCISQKTSCLWE